MIQFRVIYTHICIRYIVTFNNTHCSAVFWNQEHFLVDRVSLLTFVTFLSHAESDLLVLVTSVAFVDEFCREMFNCEASCGPAHVSFPSRSTEFLLVRRSAEGVVFLVPLSELVSSLSVL